MVCLKAPSKERFTPAHTLPHQGREDPAARRYRHLEHTADVGVIAYGGTAEEVFANAAQGMFAVIADLRRVREREERAIVVEASDLGGLLVRFLNEANYLFETQHFLFRRFQLVELTPDKRLRARGFGEPVEPTRHHVNGLVKSATYHMLEVAERRGRWRAQVILDI